MTAIFSHDPPWAHLADFSLFISCHTAFPELYTSDRLFPRSLKTING